MIGRDRNSETVFATSLAFGAVYFTILLGVPAPYPLDAAIKAGGVALLGAFAVRCGAKSLSAALFFGAIGDLALALDPPLVPVGIAAFGVGHVLYLTLFVRRIRRSGMRPMGWPLAALVLAGGGAMLAWLWPDMGALRLPAGVYNAVILIMAASAVLARGERLAAAGALLFLFSDGVLAARMFKDAPEWVGLMVWAAYFSGQALLALGFARDAVVKDARVTDAPR